MENWTCNKCGKIKPLEDFHKNSYAKNGHHGQCKVCRCKVNSVQACQWRRDNPERARENYRKWREKNKMSV